MRLALGLLALAQLAIGAAAIFARYALAAGGPIAVSALRLLIAAVPIALIACARRSYRPIERDTEWRLALAGLALAVHFGCWITSLRYASVAVSTLLVCTTPIWTEVFAVVRTRRVRNDVMSSVACALAGVTIVIGWPAQTADEPLGVSLALAGAFAMAAYLLLVRASDVRYETLAVVGRTYPIAALILLTTAGVIHDRVPPFSNAGAWGGILAMAVISQLFGHTALNAAVRRLSATFVATVTLIEPVIAGLLARVILNERLAPATYGGALLILAGIAVALDGERRAGGAKVAPVSIG